MPRKPASKLTPDPLIERLVPDASQVPDVRVLIGFLGASTRDEHWRLYFTPSLDDYVEFREDDVVHSHSLEADANRLGGTVVWVKREANLQRTRTASREAQADFLQGAIAARAASRPLGPAFANQLRLRPPGLRPASVAVHASCVREFCDIVVVSWLAGGDVYCTGSFECIEPTWQAECG